MLSRVTSKSVNEPRNVATTMCLTEKLTFECTGSDFQIPVGIAVCSVTVAIVKYILLVAILDLSNKNDSRSLSMQQLTPEISTRTTETFGHLVGAHATLTRRLSVQLESEHGLTMTEYEVLLLLSREEEHSMRRVDLSREVRLSPSGITRMLDRLEATGLVQKGHCSQDARVTYAVLTDAGMKKLHECAPAHYAAIERLIGERLSDEEVKSLSGLLGRLSDLDDDCSVGD